MKNFLEYQLSEFQLLEERQTEGGKKEVDVKVIWQKADTINQNNRRYSRDLLLREIRRINFEIDSGKTVWGACYHPADGIGTPLDISHKWKRIWMEKNGVCKGILSLLPTKSGETMQTLLKVGKVGISSRGFGTTTEKEEGGKKFLEVNDDYRMASPGDFVVAPSVEGAYASINEELNQLGKRLDEEGNFSGVALKFSTGKDVEDQLKVIYRSYVTTKKFTGTFDEFMRFWSKGEQQKNKEDKMNEKSLKPETIEAIKKMTTEEPQKQKQEKVKPSDVWVEARIAGCSAKEMAERINASADFGKEIEAVEDLTPEEKMRALKEARDAGFDVSIKEVRERALESARMSKKSKPNVPTKDERKVVEEKAKGTRLQYEERLSGGKDVLIK